jgi:alkaline phosphatase
MKKNKTAVLAMFVALLCAAQLLGAQNKQKEVKNVIILIPDGMSLAPTTLARWVKGSALSFDPYVCGLVETYSSDSTIADSAPAGSAYATGFKSQSGNIASLGKVYSAPGFALPEEGGENRPVATVLEAAKLSGRSTGIIATSEFMHATPADFSSHDPSRKSYDSISEQIIFNGIDVVLGGGSFFLQDINRADTDNLLASVTARGYALVKDTAGLKAEKSPKIFGLFASKAMAYSMDRDPAVEPSLAEMTDKAISVLSTNKKGFFLMVEGSKIDWAAHANDPVGMVGDILAFDDACRVAFEYALGNRNTVVIVVSDHGNSGFSIGDKSTNSSYDKTQYAAFTGPIKKATRTGEGLEALLDADRSNAKDIIARYYGITDLTDAETEAVKKASTGALNAVVGPMMALRSKIGFTTTGHTGEDVVLSVFDPTGNRPTGVMENTEIASYIARSMGLDLKATTDKIFVDAVAAFKAKNAEVSLDTSTDPANIRLVVKKGTVELFVIQNRDYAIVTGLPKNAKGVYVLGTDALGKEILALKADGVVVFNGSKWFIAQNIIDAIK